MVSVVLLSFEDFDLSPFLQEYKPENNIAEAIRKGTFFMGKKVYLKRVKIKYLISRMEK